MGSRHWREGSYTADFKGSPAVFDCWPPSVPWTFSWPFWHHAPGAPTASGMSSSRFPLLLWPWNGDVLRAGPHPSLALCSPVSSTSLDSVTSWICLLLKPSLLRYLLALDCQTLVCLIAHSDLLWARHLCWALGVKQVKQTCPVCARETINQARL